MVKWKARCRSGERKKRCTIFEQDGFYNQTKSNELALVCVLNRKKGENTMEYEIDSATIKTDTMGRVTYLSNLDHLQDWVDRGLVIVRVSAYDPTARSLWLV